MAGLRFLAILLLASAATGLSAQQLSLFTQYRENLTVINPAAVESDYLVFGQNMTFGASYRNQWVGLEGSPTTQVARLSYLADGMSGVALMGGAHIINDVTGPTGLTGIYGRVSGILTDDPAYGGFVVGLSAGYVQYRVNGSEIVFRDQEDNVGATNQSQMYPDLGVGLFFYKNVGRYDDIFYAGLSIPQVFGLDLTFQNANGEFLTKRVQHAYANVGFYKFFDNDSFLEPSIWVKYAPNAPTNVDVNLRYQLPSTLWVGAGVSTAQMVHLETGLILGENVGMYNTLRLGYGFGYSFSSFGPTAGNTHELNVTFSLPR
jgi:type IX secretion system PorP/SprF family membrane protein